MGIENPYGKIPITPPIEDENKQSQNKPKKRFSRRTLLKTAGLIAAGAVTSEGVRQLFTEKPNQPKAPDNLPIPKKETIPANAPKDIDQEIIGETFEEQLLNNEKVDLGESMDVAIQNKWEERYGEGGNLYLELTSSLEKMRPWINDMKSAFLYELQKSKIKLSPIEEKGFLSFVYLSIPESHFDLNAESPAGAVGPFQLTTNAAESYNLQVTENYDERKDPIFSARACAKHLLDSYQHFGKDWRMALMDYNGGLTNRYAKHLSHLEQTAEVKIRTDASPHIIQRGDTLSSIATKYNTSIDLLKRANNIEDETILIPKKILQIPQKKQSITYEGMRQWQEENINAEIARLRNKYEKKHEVKPKETLSSIANKYNTTVQEIQKLNNLHGTGITPGTELRLPYAKKEFEKAIMKSFSAQKENFNYPGKFYAVIKIIEELGLESEKKPINQYYEQNTLRKTDLIKTLRSIGKQKGITPNSDDYEHLLKINPAIGDATKILPEGTIIRVPSKKKKRIPTRETDMIAETSNGK